VSDNALQFDRAEYDGDAGAAQCEQCQQPLTFSYYQVNSSALCQTCVEAVRAAQALGTPASRAVRAIGAGFGAAVLGFLLYYGIAAMTGYEFGLIAIVVGFGVGAAVRWGSYGRGGWAYQALAIALTYLAIVSTYIPPIVSQIRQEREQAASAAPASATEGGAAAAQGADDSAPTLAQFAIGVALLFAIACAAPFLAGMQNIMGIIILGIGVYEAWKLNKKVPIEITGPHPVVRAAAAV
jgi:hypothetical protein